MVASRACVGKSAECVATRSIVSRAHRSFFVALPMWVGRQGKKIASPVKLLVENGSCCVGRMLREMRRAAGEQSNSTSVGLFYHGKRVSFCLSFVRSFFDSVERAVARSRACVLPILIFVFFAAPEEGGGR